MISLCPKIICCNVSGLDAQWDCYGLQRFLNVMALDPTIAPKRVSTDAEGQSGATDFPQITARLKTLTTRPMERRVYKRIATENEPKLDAHEMKRAVSAVVAELSTLDDVVDTMQKVRFWI